MLLFGIFGLTKRPCCFFFSRGFFLAKSKGVKGSNQDVLPGGCFGQKSENRIKHDLPLFLGVAW